MKIPLCRSSSISGITVSDPGYSNMASMLYLKERKSSDVIFNYLVNPFFLLFQ